ncbi:MAG TPA: tRNA 2-thiouridine(34) synthase MnmA [Solirubrobacterales bacterium]|nr:tRNA 2-thiouridine(34) synthase MnmA [Solirubrobacterales bacterium]
MDRELFDHFLRDEARRGPAPDDAFTGAAGGAACGDLSRLSLTVVAGRIAAVTFDTEGCGATRAATAALAETVEGATVLEAAAISIDDAEALLGGLELSKRHAAQLATDALHRALSAAAASTFPLDPSTAGAKRGAEDAPARAGEADAATARGREADPPTARGREADAAYPAANIGRPAPAERVAVAISGGVDSAVAALLERERGAEVIAITVKLWADPETDGTKACCSPEAVLGARAVAHSLGIPHFTLDLEADFRRRVVDRFVSGYAEGQTPNPCILCNGEVRLAAMLDLAQRLGADRLLTGHYARIVEDAEGPLLAAGVDAAKDQSYMLAALPPDLLGRLGFPLTEMTKEEVRAVAARHGLAVAKKPESQDLCFLAGQGKRGFLRRHGNLVDREGAVVDRAGRKLGRHRGHHNFTVGQRRGIGVSLNEPGYVIATDAAANTVTVGTREELETRRIRVRDAVLHRDGARVDNVRLRYHAATLPARVGAAAPGRHAALELELAEPFDAAAPGQTAVLMDGETIVGHGTIAAAA